MHDLKACASFQTDPFFFCWQSFASFAHLSSCAKGKLTQANLLIDETKKVAGNTPSAYQQTRCEVLSVLIARHNVYPIVAELLSIK